MKRINRHDRKRKARFVPVAERGRMSPNLLAWSFVAFVVAGFWGLDKLLPY